MTENALTVHMTGPDGDSIYEIIVGQDITPPNARKVIALSGGLDVYAMHYYKDGERTETFISKKMYEEVESANARIDIHRRSLDEIKADLESRLHRSKRT